MSLLSLVEQQKRCCRCGEVKSSSSFWKRKRKLDGLHPSCKDCNKAAEESNAGKRKQRRATLKINHWEITEEIKQRFFSKVQPGNGSCMVWTGKKKNKKGYGFFSVQGCEFTAHRTAYRLAYGNIPEGLHVLHSCDNPSCVNANHLSLGTNADNIADRVAKNRSNREPKRFYTTVEQVKEVRYRYSQGERVCNISRVTGVPERRVRAICSRETWKSIED